MERIRILTSPEIIKRKNGWSVRYRIPAHDGKPAHWSGKKKFPKMSKAAIKIKAEEYRQQVEDEENNYTIKEDITFGEYARRWHESDIRRDEINRATWNREEITIKDIENSCIANIVIDNLTIEDIEALKAEGIRRKYSNDKQRRILEKTKKILKDAVRMRRIKYSPADAVDQVKLKKTERRSLTEDEQRQLMKDIEESDQNGNIVALRIAITLGLRRGEFLGLQWGDIDFKSKQIKIVRQLTVYGTYEPPKQGSGGVLPLDKYTAAYLRKWKKKTAKEFYDGGDVPDDAPICCNTKGGKMNSRNFNRWWNNWAVDHGLGTWKEVKEVRDSNGWRREKKTGYQGYKLHELRHTVATTLLGMGADLRSVQAVMRHKNITTTSRYIHEIPKNVIEAIDALGEARKVSQ